MPETATPYPIASAPGGGASPAAYTYAEAAEILRLPAGERSIRTLVGTGQLKRTKIGHYVRISADELRDFIARNTAKAGA